MAVADLMHILQKLDCVIAKRNRARPDLALAQAKKALPEIDFAPSEVANFRIYDNP